MNYLKIQDLNMNPKIKCKIGSNLKEKQRKIYKKKKTTKNRIPRELIGGGHTNFEALSGFRVPQEEVINAKVGSQEKGREREGEREREREK